MKSKMLILILGLAGAVYGQRSSGYVFFGPGSATDTGNRTVLYAGGGGDYIVAKGLGINAELGMLWPSGCFVECVLGTFSPGGSYHFVHKLESKLDPFAVAGYTLMFRGGHENLFNFGGGLNYWLTNNLGLRAEFRDHVWSGYGTAHFWGFRFGVAFR